MCCARFDVAVFDLVRLSCPGAAVSDPPLYVMPCKQWVSRNSSVYRGIFFFVSIWWVFISIYFVQVPCNITRDMFCILPLFEPYLHALMS